MENNFDYVEILFQPLLLQNKCKILEQKNAK